MSRSPERIPGVLELLHEVWQLYPDQRLAQLVLNACRDAAGPAWPDVWNVEEPALVQGLEAMRRAAAHRGWTWVLWRQDDNGNTFVVTTFESPEAAESARRSYEARGHKQRYWVEQKKIGAEDG